jgi:hypothetical protein
VVLDGRGRVSRYLYDVAPRAAELDEAISAAARSRSAAVLGRPRAASSRSAAW